MAANEQQTSHGHFSRGAASLLLLLALLGYLAPRAAAASPQYGVITNQIARGVPLGCADVDWAAAQGLLEAVEVRWLDAAGLKCPNPQYEVMLALASKGQLACADIEWNGANGLVNYNQAAGLLYRVPGCQLTKYAFLVTLTAQGAISCADVDWHRRVGLISPVQAGWLTDALVTRGVVCAPPAAAAGASSAAGPSIPANNCDPNYDPCVPIASDVDCLGGGGNGPAYVKGPVRVIGRDIYGLDGNNNGIGCE